MSRLKFVEIVVNSMEENHQTISEFEIKLAQFNDLPKDVELLKDVSLGWFIIYIENKTELIAYLISRQCS